MQPAAPILQQGRLRDLDRRYRQLRSQDEASRKHLVGEPKDPSQEFRAIHREYADLAWCRQSSEALLCGLSLQLMATNGDLGVYIQELEEAVIDIDRAAEQKILCAIERATARGFAELSSERPLLAWALPYMLCAESWEGHKNPIYLDEIPSLKPFLREASLAWRIPDHFGLDQLVDLSPLHDWLEKLGDLPRMQRQYSPLRLKHVSHMSLIDAFQCEHPGLSVTAQAGIDNPEVADPLRASFDLFRERPSKQADLKTALTAAPSHDMASADWSRRFLAQAGSALHRIDFIIEQKLRETVGSMEAWHAVELAPEIHRFVVRELLPNRDLLIRSIEVAAVEHARTRTAHKRRAPCGQDRLLAHLLASAAHEAELRKDKVIGEAAPSANPPYEELIEFWRRAGLSLDEIERRRWAIGPLLLSTSPLQTQPAVTARTIEAFRCFVLGSFIASILSARSAVEAAASEYLATVARDDADAKSELAQLNLSGIEKEFRKTDSPQGTRLANLIRDVRNIGNQAAHNNRGNIVDHPKRWNERTALKTLKSMKKFIEESVSATAVVRVSSLG